MTKQTSVTSNEQHRPTLSDEEALLMTNWYYDLIDSTLRKQFYTFHTYHSTSSTLFTQICVLIFLVIIVPLSVLNVVVDCEVVDYDNEESHFALRLLTSCIGILASFTCCYSAIMLAIHERKDRHQQPEIDLSHPINPRHQRIRRVVQLLVGIQIYTIISFIRKTISLNCDSTSTWPHSTAFHNVLQSLGSGHCYEDSYKGLLLYLNGVVMLLTPILFYIGFPETPIGYVWSNYFLAVGTTVLSAIVLSLTSPHTGTFSVLGMCFMFLMSFMVIREMHVRGLRMFLLNQRLVDSLAETKTLHEENLQNEMKCTLANTTHDLKSVRSEYDCELVTFNSHFSIAIDLIYCWIRCHRCSTR